MKKFIGLGLFLILLNPSAFAMGRKPPIYTVDMKVDFGPANKPGSEGPLKVEKGTTPKEAVSQVFPVLSGMSCCSLREILEIGGVRVDPANNRWWTVSVNGSTKVSPRKYKLKNGDKVVWEFIQDEQ